MDLRTPHCRPLDLSLSTPAPHGRDQKALPLAQEGRASTGLRDLVVEGGEEQETLRTPLLCALAGTEKLFIFIKFSTALSTTRTRIMRMEIS